MVVSGGAGFLGKYVLQELQARGCTSLVVPRRTTCDLRKWENVCQFLDEARPHLVIHLAGVVAGIGGTRDNPAGSLYDNLIMGVQLIEAARQRNIEKLVLHNEHQTTSPWLTRFAYDCQREARRYLEEKHLGDIA